MAREAEEMQKKAVASLERDLVRSLPEANSNIALSVPPALRIFPTGDRPPGPPSPSPILSSSSTRPSTPARANRKLRFADVTSSDIHVYESAPPSPRRKPLALLPSSKDDLAVSLASDPFRPHLEVASPDKDTSAALSSVVPDGPPEEGTPEDIRRRFFPSLPTGDPSLAWIESAPPPDPTAPTLRFDLHGAPIPPTLSATLPTHLGLHHHAEGAHAGYTLDDIFLLARSTVPANVLSCLVFLQGLEEELRKRALAAGAETMGERGSLGSRAVEVLWEALVGWDEELMSVDGVELQEDPPDEASHDQGGESALKGDAISSLSLQFFLPQIATIFGTADLPHLLFNTIADEITATPSLVANVLRFFVLTPIPPSENSQLPVPDAILLLTTLASASRVSASKLLDPADALLRFVTSSPTSSPYPPPLATTLLARTLRLYTTFARYGLYAHIATTAAEPLARLSSYILSSECNSRPLLTSYISLLGAWITCASDPHQTTPPHEILWSQVSSWGWISDLATLARRLTQEPADFDTWAELWNAEAVWLEGARYNGMRGGTSEREISLARLRPGFAGGIEKEVVLGAMSSLKRLLSEIPIGYDANRGLAFYREIMKSASVLSAVIRLWLACFPPDYKSLPEPPFQLPFSLLGMVAIFTVTHPLLSEPSAIPPHTRPSLRPLVSFVINYVWLSRRHPNTPSSLWLAQLSTAVMRSLPGDEDAARGMLDAIVNLPFLASGLARPTDDANVEGEKAPRVRVAPLFPTPYSLMPTTTQRLPSRGFDFVFARDWPLLPLDHLLRSGTSSVWQHLPANWDASETDIARATLLLARVVREAVVANGTPTFAMNRAEVTFSCMKVFMLEHGQAQGAPSASGEDREEVFRDGTVGELMEALLLPSRLGASPNGLSASASEGEQDDLELAAARFLGTGTPFFQFYTDFVTLYDGISFGHQLFSELLLPPLAQRYAPDYRKLLYDDTAHVLGTVRTPVERVIGGAAGTFLWPAEPAPQVVGAQLSLLVGRRARVPVEGFVQWMAVHHVAANIWPDLRGDPPSPVADERGRKLLQALVHQGEHAVVRQVTLYWQRREGSVVLPPVCFDLEPVKRRNRLDWVKFWAQGDLVEHMEGLLGAKG
ncbi:hypothetical protein BJV78DRAFT_1282814 [Lactifluus subvellereus]|nr:hypothetical protein BJV78DRAFT_1282814 [Lactifluus subvellereus]